jgi:heat shock protein HtpX
MNWIKRIFLFGLVNLLVIVTISITLQVLGVRPYLTASGINYNSLLFFCLIWGMGGAFISLGLSRIMAKWMMGVQVIDPQTASGAEMELVRTIHHLAERAGLPKMPEVGIYQSPELNAFATGPTKSRALVAVSTGLLKSMDRTELSGVLSHEITHIANGDMVTMTLLQGVINAFVMFIARVIAFALSQNVERENRHTVQYLATIVLEIVLSLLGAITVAAFSRWREYRADAGGARLAGRESMIAALQQLQKRYEPVDSQPAYATLKIAGKSGGLMAFFASHPALEDRIAALRRA